MTLYVYKPSATNIQSLVGFHSSLFPPPHTQALIGGPQRTVRLPSVLLVARMMLDDLQGCHWMLPPSCGDGEAAASDATARSDAAAFSDAAAATPAASSSSGSRTIEEAVKVYAGLLTWCSNQKAIVANTGPSGTDEEEFRSWLLPLFAELCNSLSSASPQSVGASWASRLQCGEAGLIFLSRLCHGRGFGRPVLDLLRVHLNNSKKVRCAGYSHAPFGPDIRADASFPCQCDKLGSSYTGSC